MENRRLKLPDEAAVEAIRFHADCPFERERFPAMVCLVRNIISNKPQAIHRTALAADGIGIKRNGKTFRMSLGVIAGGAIRIVERGCDARPLHRRRRRDVSQRPTDGIAAGLVAGQRRRDRNFQACTASKVFIFSRRTNQRRERQGRRGVRSAMVRGRAQCDHRRAGHRQRPERRTAGGGTVK